MSASRPGPIKRLSLGKNKQTATGPTEPLFRGTGDEEECEEFVRSIRQKALEAERPDDAKWMAGLASTLLADRALKWHTKLPPEVQYDWTELEKALLKKFGADSPDEETTTTSGPANDSMERLSLRSSMVPTPAAAAAAPASLPSTLSLGSAPMVEALKGKMVGRIKVVSEFFPGGQGWICTTKSDHGNYWAVADPDRALIVCFHPKQFVQTLVHILNSAGTATLGLHWKKSSVEPKRGSNHWAKIVRIQRDEIDKSLKSSSDSCSGPIHNVVWSLQDDSTLQLIWTMADGTELATKIFVDTKTGIYVVADGAAFQTAHPNDKPAKLVFEPLLGDLE